MCIPGEGSIVRRMPELTPAQMYRLPWSLNDNVLSWLEPTKRCNLYCEGCYSRNDAKSDKSLEQIRSDLRTFVKDRRIDSISIAGGEPLVHPKIVEIVRIIRREFGLKVVINSNGLALTDELLADLVRAGVSGFTFHIDSTQGRPKWKGASEEDLNELRLGFATRVHDAGNVSVAFNSTITADTLKSVPALVTWAGKHIDIVHGMVFILFRTSLDRQYEYFARSKPIHPKSLVYYKEDAHQGHAPLVVNDVVREIRKVQSEFMPAAYLGGTRDPSSMKWVLATRVGTRDHVLGYIGPKSMEVLQTGHHALFGSYLGYARPALLRHGRATALGLSSVDPRARRMLLEWGRSLFKRPRSALARHHVQSLLIIQPIDMMPDGEMNMCDGCPDMTVHDGKLVWSCRLDEKLQYGCFLTASPRGCAPAASLSQTEQSL